MLKYVIIQNKKTDITKPDTFQLVLWNDRSDERITHMDAIAMLAFGKKTDVHFTQMSKEERIPFTETLSRISSWGRIYASPSRGWYVDEVESMPAYKNRLDLDCSMVIKHMTDPYGFPMMQPEVVYETYHKTAPTILAKYLGSQKTR